ncbi:MAG: AAA family ATPase [Campylobacterales bacterium]|nr:AAA family ATPase [Campylobacterales bacterium]
MANFKNSKAVLIVSALMIVLLLLVALLRDNSRLITLQEARNLIASKQVEKAVLAEVYCYFHSTQNGVFRIARDQLEKSMLDNVRVEHGRSWSWVFVVVGLLATFGGGFVLWRQWGRKSGFGVTAVADEVTAPEHSCVTPVRSKVRFSDIGGVGEVKEDLEEIIDFLKNPKRYHSFGARLPRGVLLVGPPGVGKTMIAKAVAAEADVPFFYQSGASFVQIYVGMGAKRVHELFNAAKTNAPSIIFIDEIDAVGKRRDGMRNDEREATLNQLLTEMDGFEESSGVVVLAATNNIEVMDAALLRAGRFDRRIFVELPTPKEREAILGKYLRHIPHDVKLEEIAAMSTGFSGAALAAFVNEAALLSLRLRDVRVNTEHFLAVKEKVVFGKRRINIVTPEQKRYRARYQAGKALCATWFDLPFEKITLTSDAIQPPISQPLLRHEITARIQMHLSGICACDLAFGEHATNAEGDIMQAKELIAQMIDDYAMGPSLYGNEAEKAKLLDGLYEETKKLLLGKERLLGKIEALLMEYESVSRLKVRELIGEVL